MTQLLLEGVTTIKETPRYKLQDVDVHEIRGLDHVRPAAWFIEKIKANRVIEAVLLADHGDDGYSVISGHRRAAAAKELGIGWIPAQVYDADDIESVKDILRAALNECRTDNPYDSMLSVEALCVNGSYSVETTAEATGISTPTVRALLRCSQASDLVRQEWSQDRIKYAVVRRIVELPKREQDQIDTAITAGVRITAKVVRQMKPQDPDAPMLEEVWRSRMRHLIECAPSGYDKKALLSIVNK